MSCKMELEKMLIGDYLNVLGTKNPVPGGGSVAGVTASQGIALVLMVLDLTIGKEKYKDLESEHIRLNNESRKLFEKLRKSGDDDVKAFSKVAEAYKLPKDDPNKKNKIGEYSLEATKVPFRLIKMCYEGCEITEQLVGKSNKSAASDLAVAAFCFESAAKSAWLNVKINLNYLLNAEDREFYELESKRILSKIIEKANEISEKVENAM